MIDNQKAWEEISAALIEMQAERDALAAKCVSLENFCAEVAAVFESMGDSSINSARLKRIDKEMNTDAASILADHDAEVAKAAVLSTLRTYGDTDLSHAEIVALADNYASSLNK